MWGLYNGMSSASPKVGIEVIMTPATYLVVSKLKQAENEDYFDDNTRFKFFAMN